MNIEFSENSELKTIEKDDFTEVPIKVLKIPSSVINLQDRWLNYSTDLIDLQIIEGNQRYKHYDNNFNIGKSDITNDQADINYQFWHFFLSQIFDNKMLSIGNFN